MFPTSIDLELMENYQDNTRTKVKSSFFKQPLFHYKTAYNTGTIVDKVTLMITEDNCTGYEVELNT